MDYRHSQDIVVEAHSPIAHGAILDINDTEHLLRFQFGFYLPKNLFVN